MFYSTPYCELIAPTCSIVRGVRAATVESGRFIPSSTACIVLDNRWLNFNGIVSVGDEIEVKMGYWGEYAETVFTGVVEDVAQDADVTIQAKDRMKDAHEAHIIRTFTDATPYDVVSYCVKEAGFSDMDIGGGDYPKKKHFVLRSANVTQAISLVERTWGIVGWGHYIDAEGRFVWNRWEPGEAVYTFATGGNVLDMQPYSDMWRLHTFLFPEIRHGDVVRVKDMRLGYEDEGDMFRVERMTLSYGAHNSMYLWLRRLSAIEEVERIDVFGAFQSDH